MPKNDFRRLLPRYTDYLQKNMDVRHTLELFFTSGSGTTIITTILSNASIVASSNQTSFGKGAVSQSTSGASSTIENQAVVVANPIATEISGNAAGDNTITVYIIYTILKL